MKVAMLKIPIAESKPQIEVKLNVKYRTVSGGVRTFVGYYQDESDTLGQYRTAFDHIGNVYARIYNQWGCDNGKVTGSINNSNSLLVIDNNFVEVR